MAEEVMKQKGKIWDDVVNIGANVYMSSFLVYVCPPVTNDVTALLKNFLTLP